MKVLIVSAKAKKQSSSELISQIDFLADELDKMGFQVERTDQFHPARILLNKYDIIHFIQNKNHVDLRLSLAAWSAKVLGIATVLTNYSKIQTQFMQDIEFSAFDAVTLPFTSELKKMRFFHKPKMIFPFLVNPHNLQTCVFSQTHRQFVFPVLENFEDLLKINTKMIQQLDHFQGHFFVDAHQLKKNNTPSSTLRKKWLTFTEKNSEFKKFKLFLEKETLVDVLSQSASFTFIQHLNLSSDQMAFWIETAITRNNFLIIHEDQGTGLSDLWKNEKNCFIISPRFSPAVQNHELIQVLERQMNFDQNTDTASSLVKYKFDLKNTLDAKMNELARLYTKIVSQRASLMSSNSAKMNS